MANIKKMTESDAVLAASLARRVRQPLVVTGIKSSNIITIIPASQLGRLNVDESYQRVRISNEVNEMIHAIRQGGEIPSPIDVAERPDGSWWIVDGQQRWWAHVETNQPLKATIHQVENHDAECKLFMALNSRRKVNARVIIKGWPGIAGKFMQRLNTSPTSPVRDMIDFGGRSDLPFDAVALLRGILTTTTGLEKAGGDMATVILPRTDAALSVTGRIAWAEAYVQLLSMVFNMVRGEGRVRVLPIIALAQVAHKKYVAAGRPAFPKSVNKLRRCNWDTIAPTHNVQFLDLLIKEADKRWS